MPQQRLKQQEARLMCAFHTLASENKRDLALALMERFAGITAAPETRVIVGPEPANEEDETPQPRP